MHADSSSKRMDEKHLISQRIQLPLPQLAHMLSQVGPPAPFGMQAQLCAVYTLLLCQHSSGRLHAMCRIHCLGHYVSFVEQNAVLVWHSSI